MALVIDVLVLEPLFGGITPWWWFGLTTAAILAVIYLYTRKSGMGTVIWTDTLQTACMLLAVVLTIGGILNAGGHSWSALPDVVASTDLTQVWVMDDWRLNNHWLKHILAGMFVTIAMTGLDQDMMQKNLACRNLRKPNGTWPPSLSFWSGQRAVFDHGISALDARRYHWDGPA